MFSDDFSDLLRIIQADGQTVDVVASFLKLFITDWDSSNPLTYSDLTEADKATIFENIVQHVKDSMP